MRVRLFTSRNPEKMVAAISEVLRHRLYVSGWCLSHDLVAIRKFLLNRQDYFSSQKPYRLSVVYDDLEKPVAISLALPRPHNDAYEIQCFTKKSERKKGFGRKSIAGLKIGNFIRRKKVIRNFGIDGSLSFFGKTIGC